MATPARRRPMQADHVVPSWRIADRSHHIAAIGDRQQALSQRDCRPTAAAAARKRAIPCVTGRAVHVVVAMRAQAELGHIGLSDQYCAGPSRPFHDQGIVQRQAVAEKREPPVVTMSRVSARSLGAWGNPCKGPSGPFWQSLLSNLVSSCYILNALYLWSLPKFDSLEPATRIRNYRADKNYGDQGRQYFC